MRTCLVSLTILASEHWIRGQGNLSNPCAWGETCRIQLCCMNHGHPWRCTRVYQELENHKTVPQPRSSDCVHILPDSKRGLKEHIQVASPRLGKEGYLHDSISTNIILCSERGYVYISSRMARVCSQCLTSLKNPEGGDWIRVCVWGRRVAEDDRNIPIPSNQLDHSPVLLFLSPYLPKSKLFSHFLPHFPPGREAAP